MIYFPLYEEVKYLVKEEKGSLDSLDILFSSVVCKSIIYNKSESYNNK